MGACIIEKHFTLDKNMKGPDHKASIEPNELEEMIRSIRNIECGLGTNVKKPTNSERKNISIVRKSIVASKNIKKGELFSNNNLTTKRPGLGVSPLKWYSYIGKKSDREYKKDDSIK